MFYLLIFLFTYMQHTYTQFDSHFTLHFGYIVYFASQFPLILILT